MTPKIITAADARKLSNDNTGIGFNSIMDKVEEHASQGKSEFIFYNTHLLKKWECELINLGYTITFKDGKFILSWESKSKYQELVNNIMGNNKILKVNTHKEKAQKAYISLVKIITDQKNIFPKEENDILASALNLYELIKKD